MSNCEAAAIALGVILLVTNFAWMLYVEEILRKWKNSSDEWHALYQYQDKRWRRHASKLARRIDETEEAHDANP